MKTTVTPLRLQPRDDLAQPVDVAAGQRRGRLVEQQDRRLAIDGAGDLDLLLHGEVEVADFVVADRCRRDRASRNARDRRASRLRRSIMPERVRRAHRAAACCRARSDRAPASFPGTRSGCRAHGRRAASRAGTSLPKTLNLPGVGLRSSPDSSLTIVDLPAPFSPSSACTLPGSIAKRHVVDARPSRRTPCGCRRRCDGADRVGMLMRRSARRHRICRKNRRGAAQRSEPPLRQARIAHADSALPAGRPARR